MKAYLERLRHHPGAPVVALWQTVTFISLLLDERGIKAALIGTLIMGVFWIPVLITNRSSQ